MVTSILPLRPYQRNVTTVFQNYALFPHLTVRGNIEFGLRRRGIRDRAGRVRDAIETGPARRQGRPAAGPVIGRRAPACRPRPRARGAARRPPPRRASLRPRPPTPQAAAHRVEGAAAARRHHLPVRHPRSGGGALHVRPHRGDARRARRTGRIAARVVCLARRPVSSPASWARSIGSTAGACGPNSRASPASFRLPKCGPSRPAWNRRCSWATWSTSNPALASGERVVAELPASESTLRARRLRPPLVAARRRVAAAAMKRLRAAFLAPAYTVTVLLFLIPAGHRPRLQLPLARRVRRSRQRTGPPRTTGASSIRSTASSSCARSRSPSPPRSSAWCSDFRWRCSSPAPRSARTCTCSW